MPGRMELLLRLFVFMMTVITAVQSSMLSVPRNYSIFQGPLNFGFAASSVTLNQTLGAPTVQLVSTRDNEVVATANIPTGYDEAEMTIECGTVDLPGLFRFRLVDQDGVSVLEDTEVTYASWPHVTITLPRHHRTLSGELTLYLTSSGITCDSMRPDSTFTLEVLYLGPNESQTTYVQRNSTAVVFSETLRTLSGLEEDVPITLPCSVIDQAGIYQAVLRSSRDPGNPIAISNTLDVHWSESYGVTLNGDSLYPCGGTVTVHYSQPQCPGVDDKIRLYRQTSSKVGGPLPGEGRLEYVMEMKAKTNANTVGFACHRFNASVPGYCFKYVSVAKSRAVHEQKIVCLPTHPEVSVGVSWSPWSEWSPCFGCGSKRRRFRTCDAGPSPSSPSRPYLPMTGDGAPCPGPAFDWSACSEPRCLDAEHEHTASTQHPVTSDPLCACGCSMSRSEGQVMSSTGCRLPSLWRIEVSEGHVVRLTFDRFDLDERNPTTWVKVRDGHSHIDSLLVFSYGGAAPHPATTKQNRMLVEYRGPSDGQGPFRTRNNEGFIATYTAIADHDVGHRADRKKSGAGGGSGQQAIWESAVTVAGISLCVLIVVVSIGFVCHHHLAQRRLRAKLLHTPAHQALLGGQGEAAAAPGTCQPPGSGSSSHRRKSSSTPPTGGGSRRPSVGDPTPWTPGSVRAGVPSLQHASTPDLPRKPASGASPAMSRHSRASHHHQQQQQQPSKMMALQQQMRQQRRNPDADDEVLSSTEARKNLSTRGQASSRCEEIPLESYRRRNRKPAQTAEDDDDDSRAFIYEKRPPVEGRDSLTRDKSIEDELADQGARDPALQKARFIPPKRSQLAEIRDLRPGREASINPHQLRSLDLKPHEGQSSYPATPMSVTSAGELSLTLETDLFPDPVTCESPCDFITTDEFEYDDYVSQLPGSYFTMDPTAYTLTWSQHPPWASTAAQASAPKTIASRTNSQASIDPDRLYY